MDIVVTGCAGFDASREIYLNDEYREKLLERYSESFFGVLKNEYPEGGVLFPALENAAAGSPWTEVENASDGGVYAALWRLLKDRGLGAEYSERAIPVLQQTIEICETFERNPFRMSAKSCNVWLTGDSDGLISIARKKGIEAAVIGHTAKGKAIKRTDGFTEAFLRRPESLS